MSRQAFRWRALTSVAVLVLAGLPGQAQTSSEGPVALPAGSRLRVTRVEGNGAEARQTKLVGRLVGMSPESLGVDTGSSESRIPYDSIVRVERSLHPSRRGRGAVIGFGVGFVAMFGLFTGLSEGECFQSDLGFCLGWSAVFALPAAAVGAIVAPGEQWAEVRLRRAAPAPVARSSDEGLHLRVIPIVGGRTGLAVTGSF